MHTRTPIFLIAFALLCTIPAMAHQPPLHLPFVHHTPDTILPAPDTIPAHPVILEISKAQPDTTLLNGDVIAATIARMDTSVAPPATAVAVPAFMQRFRKLSAHEASQSITRYRTEQLAARQRLLVNEVTRVARRIQIYLSGGPDSGALRRDLAFVQRSFTTAKDGVLVNQGSVQTQRNLAVSSTIVTRLLAEVEEHKTTIDSYTNDLLHFRNSIDSLYTDSLLYVLPGDSAATMQYLMRLVVVAKEIEPVDSALTLSLKKAEQFQLQADQLRYELRSVAEDLETGRQALARRRLQQEAGYLYAPPRDVRPLHQIIRFSLAKERLAFLFFFRGKGWTLLLLALLVMMVNLFIRSLRKRLMAAGLLDVESPMQLVVKHPLAAAILIVCSVLQFYFLDAPFVFNFALWLACALCLSRLLHGYSVAYWTRFWTVNTVLFTLACLDNFILQVSRTERWMVFGLALAGCMYNAYILLGGRLSQLRERGVIYAIVFLLFNESISLLLNFLGRYNLGKTLMVAGYSGVIIAIFFMWTLRLINDGLRLASLIYRQPERDLLYLNFDKVGNRVPWLFYVFFVVGWFIMVGHNFYGFREISQPFNDFLLREHTIGDYTYTVNGLFFFLLITGCSLILSRVISYFAYDPSASNGSDGSGTRFTAGSWILLARIFIITCGLLLAFAAAGIPMDKLTIILGALSVGIGLGLQSLVANLVSGLVIAFEKPVNVGDFIEVNGKPGTMKSIGFRSSVVNLVDGANMIIPNGDLLSQHLVNWTTARNLKCLHVVISVAHGSNLVLVQHTLRNTLDGDARILGNPAPLVVAKAFTEQAIDFEMLFWIKNFAEGMSVTGDVLNRIDVAFRDAGIVVPFRQHDVYVHRVDGREDEHPL